MWIAGCLFGLCSPFCVRLKHFCGTFCVPCSTLYAPLNQRFFNPKKWDVFFLLICVLYAFLVILYAFCMWKKLKACVLYAPKMTTKRPRKLGRLFINWWSLGGHFFILMVIWWHLVVTKNAPKNWICDKIKTKFNEVFFCSPSQQHKTKEWWLILKYPYLSWN